MPSPERVGGNPGLPEPVARNKIYNPESLSQAQLGKGSKRLKIILFLGERMDYHPVIQ
jgi:hypothetical protein